MKKADSKFGKWLDDECRKRGWSHGELGRRAHVSEARVSQVCRGWTPGIKFLSSVAAPLGISQYEIWQRAGITLPTRLENPVQQEMLEEFSKLSAPQKRLAISLIRAVKDSRNGRH